MTTAKKVTNKVDNRTVTKTFYLGYNDSGKEIDIYDHASGPEDDCFDRSQPLTITFVLPQQPLKEKAIDLGRVVVKK